MILLFPNLLNHQVPQLPSTLTHSRTFPHRADSQQPSIIPLTLRNKCLEKKKEKSTLYVIAIRTARSAKRAYQCERKHAFNSPRLYLNQPPPRRMPCRPDTGAATSRPYRSSRTTWGSPIPWVEVELLQGQSQPLAETSPTY